MNGPLLRILAMAIVVVAVLAAIRMLLITT